MKDLGELIHRQNASYSKRYSKALLDELVHVGDPLADDATAAIHEEAYNPDGGQLQQLRRLADTGDARAQAFFAAAERPPEWLEPALIERGQKLALSYTRPYGLSLTHSLFSGALFARATLVIGSTGRIGSNPQRRVQETGAFIGAILQPRGLEPGSLGHDTALRVRLLHGSIRSWLRRSPGFEDAYYGTPIDQTMLAMTLGLFDYLNLRSLVRLGLPLTDDDLRAHHHMWRYIGHLIGIDERLLTENLECERELWSALVTHQAFPELFGENFLRQATAMIAGLVGASGWADGVVRSFLLFLSGATWFGVAKTRQRDPLVDIAWLLGRGVGTARNWIPGVADFLEQEGNALFAEAQGMARTHGFGVRVERDDENEDQEVAWQAMAAGVRARFALRERPRRNSTTVATVTDAGATDVASADAVA